MTQTAIDFDAPDTRTFTGRVAEYFKARPGQWIDGRQLETIGGRYAWRSRVSDCRRDFGMVIANRVRTIKTVVGVYREGKINDEAAFVEFLKNGLK